MDGKSKLQVHFQDDEDDGAETEEEEDGDGGPGLNENENGPNVPVGSCDLWIQGTLGDTLTTLAQHDWLIQYMPDDGDGWADNAMLMLQYLGMPEHADQCLQSSVEERKELLKYYASQGHRVPPPPTDVSAVCRGQEVSMAGLRNFMQAAVNSGAAPFQTMDVADAHESSSIQIENEHQEMSKEEGLPRGCYPPPPPCYPPVYAGSGLGSRDQNAFGAEYIPHHVRRGHANELDYKRDEERFGISWETENISESKEVDSLETEDATDTFDFAMWSDLINHDWHKDEQDFEHEEGNLGPD